jgi:hypothetical protein
MLRNPRLWAQIILVNLQFGHHVSDCALGVLPKAVEVPHLALGALSIALRILPMTAGVLPIALGVRPIALGTLPMTSGVPMDLGTHGFHGYLWNPRVHMGSMVNHEIHGSAMKSMGAHGSHLPQ